MDDGAQQRSFDGIVARVGAEHSAQGAGAVVRPDSWIEIQIPGEPVAQGRGRAFGFRRHDGSIGARVFDPEKSRSWKAVVQDRMIAMMDGRPPLAGPVAVELVACFTCPRSQWRKREPMPERWKPGRPDIDNLYKGIADSGNGVVWIDDAQIVSACISKRIAAQGHAPGVVLRVRELVEA